MTLADDRLAGHCDAKYVLKLVHTLGLNNQCLVYRLSPAKPLEILSELITMASFKAGVLDCLQRSSTLLAYIMLSLPILFL